MQTNLYTKVGTIIALLICFGLGWAVFNNKEKVQSGDINQVGPGQEQQAPSVLQPELNKKVQTKQRGAWLQSGAKGATRQGVRWAFFTEKLNITAVDIDGQEIPAAQGKTLPGAILSLRGSTKLGVKQVQTALREIVKDPRLLVVKHHVRGQQVIKSDLVVAMPFSTKRKKVNINSVYLRSDCAKRKQYPAALGLQAACDSLKQPPKKKIPQSVAKKLLKQQGKAR